MITFLLIILGLVVAGLGGAMVHLLMREVKDVED